MHRFAIAMGLAWASLTATAQNVGVLRPGGTAITPAEEGRLLRLVTRPAQAGTPTYTLVREGGEAVLIMNAQGHVLTPTEAWEEFGGQRVRPAPASRHPAESSFSVPNAPRSR